MARARSTARTARAESDVPVESDGFFVDAELAREIDRSVRELAQGKGVPGAKVLARLRRRIRQGRAASK